MLPTYLEPDLFLGKGSFVQKPSFGREGDTITIRDKDENIMLQNAHETYKASLPIFQKVYRTASRILGNRKRDRETVICVWFVFNCWKSE
ncbi:glutathionylspermidine synthase family protein [Bacillus cereus]